MTDLELTGYTVFWESGDRSLMTSRELRDLPFDLASWASFLSMLSQRRSHAVMTLHASATERMKVKVLPIEKVAKDTTYQSIT